MDRDRWRRIEALYHAALAQSPEERSAFLSEACADDATLREDVESLLAQSTSTLGLLDRRALDLTASTTLEPGGLHGLPPPIERREIVGTEVGPYKVLQRLGAGGMGEVFLGQDTRLDRKVALKRLTPTTPGRDETARILREARAAARLNHPKIAGVHDVLEHDGCAFIVMEYVEGHTLRERLEGGPLQIAEALSIARQLAAALAAAHAQGVIHRDLKPANVQLMADGSAKILDFGVAVVGPRDATTERVTSTTTAKLAARLDFAGTPTYMAPEQLLFGLTDARSDIYSLGVILFEMLTGRRPFPGDAASLVAVALSAEKPPEADALNPDVPDALSAIVAKALDRDPVARFQSAGELEQQLGGIAGGDNPQKRRVRIAALAGALALAGGFLLAGPTFFSRPPVTLALLPLDNPTADRSAAYLGGTLLSALAANLRSAPEVTVLARDVTSGHSRDQEGLARLGRELGAGLILDIGILSVRPTTRVTLRVWRPDQSVPLVNETFAGDAATATRDLLEAVASTLESDAGWGRRLDDEARTRLVRVPTADGEALVKLAEARVLLERNEIPGNVARAVGLLEQATRADSTFAAAFAALADGLRLQSVSESDAALLERARAAASTALQLDSGMAAAHLAWANIQVASGARDAAVISLRRTIELEPDNDAAHRSLGRVLADRGDIDAAVAELRLAIRLRPDSINTYLALGEILGAASRHEEALEAYRQAAELEPQNSVVHSRMGVTHGMLGQIDQAIGHYEHALRLRPSATVHANLGLAYFTADQLENALAHFQAAVKLDPRGAAYHRSMGDVLRRLTRTAEAQREYHQAIGLANEALAVKSRDASSVVLIALCEANLGRRAAAERRAAEALVLAPQNREVVFRVAKAYAIAGNTAKAFEHLSLAIALGYVAQVARMDPELKSLRGAEFERAIAAGLERGRS